MPITVLVGDDSALIRSLPSKIVRADATQLTGMGKDGACGLLAIREAGGYTVASCVVYGMPREAAEIDAAEEVLPLEDIGPALLAQARKRGNGNRV